MPTAILLTLPRAARAELEALARSHRGRADEARRARIIQALDRRDPILPLSPGRAERHGFEYVRHGTLSLYAVPSLPSPDL